jgi:hypothetical protein
MEYYEVNNNPENLEYKEADPKKGRAVADSASIIQIEQILTVLSSTCCSKASDANSEEEHGRRLRDRGSCVTKSELDIVISKIITPSPILSTLNIS